MPFVLQAINNVEAYVPPAISFDPGEAPGEIFGANVFTKAVMQTAAAEVGLQVRRRDHREAAPSSTRRSPTSSRRR